MKIILIRNVSSDSYGGAETYQLKLAHTLRNNKIEPIIVSSSKKLLQHGKKQHFKTIRAPFFHNQNWSSWRNLFLPIYVIWQIRLYFWYKKLFCTIRPHAINIQSRDDWIAATLAAKKTKIKIFWTDHIDFRTWVFQNIHQKYKNPIGKYILHLSKIPNKIIMISEFEYNYACKNIFLKTPKNLTIIKNGAIDKKRDFSPKKHVPQSFCYVGRLIDYKGIRELIAAFKSVSKEFPQATLSIYGDGKSDDTKRYQKLADKDPNIMFFGYTEEPLEAIARAQYFVLPSYYEGMSLSLLDAIMMQKTIIATNVDGNPEIIKDKVSGLLVSAKDKNALATAMLTVLRDPRFSERLAVSARLSYEKSFDFETITAKQIIPLLLGQ